MTQLVIRCEPTLSARFPDMGYFILAVIFACLKPRYRGPIELTYATSASPLSPPLRRAESAIASPSGKSCRRMQSKTVRSSVVADTPETVTEISLRAWPP